MIKRRVAKAVLLTMLILPLTIIAEFFAKRSVRRVLTGGKAT
ncbi:MAG: hypothetical protein OEW04_15840 [Nitrospirota bacterium]|nr:hypothetical protein [Nitrospirota bacterium]